VSYWEFLNGRQRWKTEESVKIREFIDNYKEGLKIIDSYIPKNEKKKVDCIRWGGHRLQSVFITLKCGYEAKELYFKKVKKN